MKFKLIFCTEQNCRGELCVCALQLCSIVSEPRGINIHNSEKALALLFDSLVIISCYYLQPCFVCPDPILNSAMLKWSFFLSGASCHQSSCKTG